MSKNYLFSWDLIGDIKQGRPNLGPYTRIEVYRLMHFVFRDVLAQHVGTAKTDEIFFEAGKLAGVHLYEKYCDGVTDTSDFLARIQQLLRELGIGILRIESADLETCCLTLTISEDLDCSGLPEGDHGICVYDEGFIAGLLESFTGKRFQVREVDCWCTGDRTCRFKAHVLETK